MQVSTHLFPLSLKCTQSHAHKKKAIACHYVYDTMCRHISLMRLIVYNVLTGRGHQLFSSSVSSMNIIYAISHVYILMHPQFMMKPLVHSSLDQDKKIKHLIKFAIPCLISSCTSAFNYSTFEVTSNIANEKIPFAFRPPINITFILGHIVTCFILHAGFLNQTTSAQ